MIQRIRTMILMSRRRTQVEADLELAYAEVHRQRPRKIYRQREWTRELSTLDAVLKWLVRATTIAEIDKQRVAMNQAVERCKALVDREAQVAASIESAAKTADQLRQRAASLPGSLFQQDVTRKHHAIKEECSHARRARDTREEAASLASIQEKLNALEAAIERAERVTVAMPAIEAHIGSIKAEDVWLDMGTKETYDDILATFSETQRDIRRGEYDKAAQRLREVESLRGHLMDSLGRRAIWALEEVRMWRNCDSVAAAFPQLAAFPTTTMSPSDIESLYALRPDIERFVIDRANIQRERNTPARDIINGRKLAASHPLRMPFEDCTDFNELDEFLRCVTAFGR